MHAHACIFIYMYHKQPLAIMIFIWDEDTSSLLLLGDQVILRTSSHPIFIQPWYSTFVTFYSSSDWSRARSFAKVIDKKAVRSSFICTFEGTLLLINNILRRLPCPFNGDCSAGRLYRCAWRARSRHPHTHATCERRIDAKASSEDAVADVEVDRCIDENSASNYGWVALLSFHRSSIDQYSSKY